MNEPLISIVTVCLNAREHLERCIKSVIGQSYRNIEYIVIDGGSTDGTLDILRKYDNQITYWVSGKDGGIYDAMNKGIGICKGSYIGLLNSDDYYAEDSIKKIIEVINHDPNIDVIHGDMVVLDFEGNRISKGCHNTLFEKTSVKHPTCFISSSIYEIFRYNPTIKISADYDFLLMLYMSGKKFKYVDFVTTYFSPYGVSSKPSFSAVIERYKIRSKYKKSDAILIMVKETVQYFDELCYMLSNIYGKSHSKNKFGYLMYRYSKVMFSPLLHSIKKRMQ